MFSSVVFCSIISEGVFGRSFSPTSFPYTIYIHLLIIISHIWNSITSFFNHKIQSIGCNSPDISVYIAKSPQNIPLPLSLPILLPSRRRRLVRSFPRKYTNFLPGYSPASCPATNFDRLEIRIYTFLIRLYYACPSRFAVSGDPAHEKGRTRWDPDLALPGTHLHFWANTLLKRLKFRRLRGVLLLLLLFYLDIYRFN